VQLALLRGLGLVAFHVRLGDAMTAVQDRYRGTIPILREFDARHRSTDYRRFNRLWYLAAGLVAVGLGVYGS